LADWFACPLCGHQRPIAGWNPLHYGNDIKIREVVGKGKRHGFEAYDERSASQDSAVKYRQKILF
jgi:hypothetical protein